MLEDGKPQTVETFRLVKVDGDGAGRDAARPIRTRDDEETRRGQTRTRASSCSSSTTITCGSATAWRSRKPLVEFVADQLGPRDLVAVMYPLTPLDGVTLTRDHESVIRALERFEGRKFDYDAAQRDRGALRAAIRPRPSSGSAARCRCRRCEGLSVKLGALREGRKAIVLVSEGFTAMLPPQMRDPVAAMPGVGNPARRNPIAGENSIAEDRADVHRASSTCSSELREVFDAANRNNTAIYAVDPRGLATGEFDINENVGMRASQRRRCGRRRTRCASLADETDGRAIVNRNDLAQGHEADRARLERLLPARLQLDAGAAATASSTRSRCA